MDICAIMTAQYPQLAACPHVDRRGFQMFRCRHNDSSISSNKGKTMVQKEMTSKTGKSFLLEYPEKEHSEKVFVVAAHKTGSVLLNNIVSDICEASKIPHIPIEVLTWRQGISIPDWSDDLYLFMEENNYIYHGFRGLYKLDAINGFEDSKKIFLIRDPRDVAVSYYFSMLKSHSVPKKGDTKKNMETIRKEVEQMTVDEFVLSGKADFIIRNMIRFYDVIKDDDNSRLYKYENVIFSKTEWVADIAKVLNADLDVAEVESIAKKHDIIPSEEDDSKHIRQVKPGNYKKHLSKESIDYIETNFDQMFKIYQYKKENE